MVPDFDVRDFLSNCKANKPPFTCPCGKTYKSLNGIQQHVNQSHLMNSSNKKRILGSSTNKKNPMYYDEDSNAFNSTANNVGKTRETLTYAEAQRMIEVEIDGLIHRININEPMNIISLDPESNRNDKLALENYQTPEIYSNHNESFAANKPSASNGNNHLSSSNAKKSTKKSRSKSKETSAKKKPSKHNGPTNPPSTGNHAPASTKLPEPSFRIIDNRKPILAPPRPIPYYRYIDKSSEELDETVEYDMDEEDFSWLELINKKRLKDNLTQIPPDTFELLMDRLEKECYFLNQTNANGDYYSSPAIDEDAVCCICNDGECQNSNAILFCDMCDLPVHQECYGVPYIPEGQWLCRRCLQSPSRGVNCILCPNKGGAFKQTDDGKWCHVVCALWIPEVCFANTVFLEPIDNIGAIPSARWKLICYICKEKNNGACIQCHKGNCYVAFHVTCAQQAGLHMRMEAVREFNANGVNTYIRKEAYCHAHMPTEQADSVNLPSIQNHSSDDEQSYFEESSFSEEDSNSNSRKRKRSLNNNGRFKSNKKSAKENNSFNEAALSQKRQIKAKMKKARRILAEKRSACPTVSIPTIPAERLTEIANLINIPKRNQFVQRLLGYWTLKRESRNGVPLLRRLQVSHANSRHKALMKTDESSEELNNEQTMQLKAELQEMFRLRKDLEKARILVELIRKREKVKREVLRNLEQITQLQLNPFNTFLDSVLNQLKAKDTNGFFLFPVDTNEVRDYLQFIKQPMSFQDMKRKIDHFEYSSFDEFEADFNLIVENCTLYNQKTTIYFKSAVRLREQCKGIFRQARATIEEIGFDEKSGIHHPEVQMATVERPRAFAQFAKDDDYRKELESRLGRLKEDLEHTIAKKSGGTRSKKLRHLNDEIEKVNKELVSLQGFNSFIERDQTQNNGYPMDLQLNLESLPKSPKNGKAGRPSLKGAANDGRKGQQNGSTSGLKSPAASNDPPVYPVFNFKRVFNMVNEKSSGSLNNSNTSTPAQKRKQPADGAGSSGRPNKHRKTTPNELSMKPITSYFLQNNNNSDSFKVYRSRSDSSDSPTSDRDSSSKSSSASNSSSSSSSSSSSLNDQLNEESSSGAANCEAESSVEEGRSRKKAKKSHKN